MSRRGGGEGTINKRDDGRFEGRLWMPHVDGRIVRKSFYGATRKAVQARMTRCLSDRQTGILAVSERTSTATYLEMWLAEFAKPRLKPRTFEGYTDQMERHIVPQFGNTPLTKLTAQKIQEWVNLKGTTVSPRTVRYMFAVLRSALRKACTLRLLQHDPTVAIELPRASRYVPRTLAPEDAQRLVTACQVAKHGALFAVILGLGLRIGEGLALRWSDLDLSDTATLRVRRTLHRTKVGVIFTEPKSDTSRRSLALPPFAVTLLERHSIEQLQERKIAGKSWHDGDLVFATPVGTPLDHSNVTKAFQRLLKTLNLPLMRLHDLRHTCASLLVGQGVHLKVIQDVLGHSQISLTADTYSHVAEPQRRDAADKIQDALVLRDPPTSTDVVVSEVVNRDPATPSSRNC